MACHCLHLRDSKEFFALLKQRDPELILKMVKCVLSAAKRGKEQIDIFDVTFKNMDSLSFGINQCQYKEMLGNCMEDLKLGTIYQWARELAKQYCPVIAVSQADVSGEGKKWLTMENVSNAKTAKQAAADWILGIGCTFNDSEQFDRFLHLSKNKLTGDSDTLPELRHGKMSVRIVPELARYED